MGAALSNDEALVHAAADGDAQTYNQNMDKLRPLLKENTLVPYITLLKQLHLPKVHVDNKELRARERYVLQIAVRSRAARGSGRH